MKVHFLGTSSACPSLTRNVSATGVSFESTKSWLLVDCGEGTQHQILKSELTAYHLSVILVSHLHGDHCYGLPGLIASVSLAGRTQPVTLIAPQAVIDFVLNALALTQMETGFELKTLAIEEIENTVEFDFFHVQIATLKHRVPSYGFKLIESSIPNKLRIKKLKNEGIATGRHFNQLQKGQDVQFLGQKLSASDYTFPSWRPRKVIICGDNEKPSLLKGYVDDIDLLVHEATFTSADLRRVGTHTGHSDAKRIALFANEYQVPQLALFHFSSRYHGPEMLAPLTQEALAHYHGELILADDGLTIHIDKQVQSTEE